MLMLVSLKWKLFSLYIYRLLLLENSFILDICQDWRGHIPQENKAQRIYISACSSAQYKLEVIGFWAQFAHVV